MDPDNPHGLRYWLIYTFSRNVLFFLSSGINDSCHLLMHQVSLGRSLCLITLAMSLLSGQQLQKFKLGRALSLHISTREHSALLILRRTVEGGEKDALHHADVLKCSQAGHVPVSYGKAWLCTGLLLIHKSVSEKSKTSSKHP